MNLGDLLTRMNLGLPDRFLDLRAIAGKWVNGV